MCDVFSVKKYVIYGLRCLVNLRVHFLCIVFKIVFKCVIIFHCLINDNHARPAA